MTVASILQKLKYRWTVAGQWDSSAGPLPLSALNRGESYEVCTTEVVEPSSGAVMLVGERYRLRATGKLFCTSCSKAVRKLYSGYCGECLTSRAEADACVLSPVKCHYLSGTCREPEWGLTCCYQPHVVYLSYTGDFKVGVTRASQLPVRWIDQGATWAVPLAQVGSRHQAGVIEALLSEHFSDRTQWQRMLKSANERPLLDEVESALKKIRGLRNDLGPLDSLHVRVSAPPKAPDAGSVVWIDTPSVFEIAHTKAKIPSLMVSLNFAKQEEIEGSLEGVKGQYLVFDSGVFNVRRHEGFEVEGLTSPSDFS